MKTNNPDDTPSPSNTIPTWRGRIFNLISHPTIWRFIALVVAVVSTILSGGAAIPIATLALTFIGSLIGVVGKTFQIKKLEKYRLQHHILTTIHEKHSDLESLREKNPNIFSALEKLKSKNETLIHKIPVGEATRTKSFLKTLRDVGLENALSFIAFGSATNFSGLITYLAGVGLAIKNIKDEFDTRVEHDLEINKRRIEINTLCETLKIPTYNRTKELSAIFKEKMLEYESIKKLCTELGESAKNMSEKDIQSRFIEIKEKLREEITIHAPESVPFGKKLWDALCPWRMEMARSFNSNASPTYSLASEKRSITATENHKNRNHVQNLGRTNKDLTAPPHRF